MGWYTNGGVDTANVSIEVRTVQFRGRQISKHDLAMDVEINENEIHPFYFSSSSSMPHTDQLLTHDRSFVVYARKVSILQDATGLRWNYFASINSKFTDSGATYLGNVLKIGSKRDTLHRDDVYARGLTTWINRIVSSQPVTPANGEREQSIFRFLPPHKMINKQIFGQLQHTIVW